MQTSRTVEIWVGVFVAIGLLSLFFVAMQVSNLGEFRTARDSYMIKAHFGNIGGLRVRAPVSMAGVTVGRVERIGFDEKRYEAVVEMRIDPAYRTLPQDTSASILTAGLLGEQYVGLSPGGSEDYLGDGDEIELTQSAMVLEQLISKFLFNKAEEGKGDKGATATPPPAPADTPAAADVPPPATLPVANPPVVAVPPVKVPQVKALDGAGGQTAVTRPKPRPLHPASKEVQPHGKSAEPKTPPAADKKHSDKKPSKTD